MVVGGTRPGDAARTDVSPPGVSVRSRVHEYGGGAATVADGVAVLRRPGRPGLVPGRTSTARSGPPSPSPRQAPVPEAPPCRHADGRTTPVGRWLVSVEERTDGGRDRPPAGGGAGRRTGARWSPWSIDGDFVAAPRPLARRAVAGLGHLGPPGHALGHARSCGWPGSSTTPASITPGRPPGVAGGRGSRWANRRWAGTAACCSSTTARAGGCPTGWRPAGPDGRWAGAVAAAGRPGGRVPRTRLGVRPVNLWPSWPTVPWSPAWGPEVGDRLVRLRPARPARRARIRGADPGRSTDGRPTVREPGRRWRDRSRTGPGAVRAGLDSDRGPRGASRSTLYGARPARRLSARPPVRRRPGAGGDRASDGRPTPAGRRRARPVLRADQSRRRSRAPTGSPPLVVFCHGGPTSAAEPRLRPGGAVLHQPGPRRGRGRLPGEHRLRTRLPRRPLGGLGRGRRRRLRGLRPVAGRRGAGRRAPHGHPGHQRRRADRPRRPDPVPRSSPGRRPGTG